MHKRLPLALIACALACSTAAAQERKAYKYVDEKGNVTYSQTPPASGRDSKQVDISPANSSRGGAMPQSYFPAAPGYTPDRYSYQDAGRARARQAEEAKRQRLANLEAECMRARGTDCRDPEALRYLESSKIPGPRRR